MARRPTSWSALDALQAEPDAGDLPAALRVAAGLAAPEAANGSQVVAVTDGAFELQLPQQAVPVSFRLVGGSGQNLAVSEVSLRRPIDRADYLAGFARVVNFGADARQTSITIVADSLTGRPIAASGARRRTRRGSLQSPRRRSVGVGRAGRSRRPAGRHPGSTWPATPAGRAERPSSRTRRQPGSTCCRSCPT